MMVRMAIQNAAPMQMPRESFRTGCAMLTQPHSKRKPLDRSEAQNQRSRRQETVVRLCGIVLGSCGLCLETQVVVFVPLSLGNACLAYLPRQHEGERREEHQAAIHGGALEDDLQRSRIDVKSLGAIAVRIVTRPALNA